MVVISIKEGLLLFIKMSDLSEIEEPYEDSGSEYIPGDSDDEEEDDLSSASDTDDEASVPVTMGDFTAVADPFSVSSLTYIAFIMCLLCVFLGRQSLRTGAIF